MLIFDSIPNQPSMKDKFYVNFLLLNRFYISYNIYNEHTVMVNKAEVQHAKDVLNTYKNEFNAYNIQGSAVGFKRRDGTPTNEIALIFYVKNKKNEEELKKEGIKKIPKEIEGIPTDVVAVPGGFVARKTP